jgi:hypothetical protein
MNRTIRTLLLVEAASFVVASLVGVFTIIIGIGPRTVPDVVYHAGIVVLLIYGLVAARRVARS